MNIYYAFRRFAARLHAVIVMRMTLAHHGISEVMLAMTPSSLEGYIQYAPPRHVRSKKTLSDSSSAVRVEPLTQSR